MARLLKSTFSTFILTSCLCVASAGCEDKKDSAQGGVTAPTSIEAGTDTTEDGAKASADGEEALHEPSEELCALLSAEAVAKLGETSTEELKTSRRIRGGDQIRCKVYDSPISVTMQLDVRKTPASAKTKWENVTRDKTDEEKAAERRLVEETVKKAADEETKKAGKEAEAAMKKSLGEDAPLEQEQGEAPTFETVEAGCAGATYKNGYNLMKMGGMESKSYYNTLYLHEDNVFITLTVQIDPEDPSRNKEAAIALGKDVCTGL